MLRIPVLLLLVGLLVSCAAPRTDTTVVDQTTVVTASSDPTTEVYAVYAAYIQQTWAADHVIVMLDHTDITYATAVAPRLGPLTNLLEADTVARFEAANTATVPLRDHFTMPQTRVFLTHEAHDQLFQGDLPQSWTRFYTIYPHAQGILSFSNIGFNAAMTQALLYVGNAERELAGTGSYVLLTKRGDTWTVADHVVVWMS